MDTEDKTSQQRIARITAHAQWLREEEKHDPGIIRRGLEAAEGRGDFAKDPVPVEAEALRMAQRLIEASEHGFTIKDSIPVVTDSQHTGNGSTHAQLDPEEGRKQKSVPLRERDINRAIKNILNARPPYELAIEFISTKAKGSYNKVPPSVRAEAVRRTLVSKLESDSVDTNAKMQAVEILRGDILQARTDPEAIQEALQFIHATQSNEEQIPQSSKKRAKQVAGRDSKQEPHVSSSADTELQPAMPQARDVPPGAMVAAVGRSTPVTKRSSFLSREVMTSAAVLSSRSAPVPPDSVKEEPVKAKRKMLLVAAETPMAAPTAPESGKKTPASQTSPEYDDLMPSDFDQISVRQFWERVKQLADGQSPEALFRRIANAKQDISSGKAIHHNYLRALDEAIKEQHRRVKMRSSNGKPDATVKPTPTNKPTRPVSTSRADPAPTPKKRIEDYLQEFVHETPEKIDMLLGREESRLKLEQQRAGIGQTVDPTVYLLALRRAAELHSKYSRRDPGAPRER